MPSDSRFSIVDLTQLGDMYVLEDLDSEKVIRTRMLRLKEFWTKADPPLGAIYDVENLEFDPLKINQENNTLFELLLRDRVNQAAKAVTLAFSISTDLDAIASRYPGGVPRLENETDDAYRRRIQLSVNPLSPHGAAGTYIFWALTSDVGLKDASEYVEKEGSGEVILTVMDNSIPVKTQTGAYSYSYASDPRPSQSRIIDIRAYIHDDYRKAGTDVLIVSYPVIIDTSYKLNVWLFPGPDQKLIMSGIVTKLEELIEKQRWLGYDHARAAIDAAAFLPGVHSIDIVSPAVDVSASPRQVVRVNSLEVNFMGRKE